MHTPEQARELWCPMVRIARYECVNGAQPTSDFVIGGCNTDAMGRNRVPMSCRCIADECAMWRWSRPPVHDPYPTPTEDAENGGLGYCGLAGRQITD